MKMIVRLVRIGTKKTLLMAKIAKVLHEEGLAEEE
jgi:hypothetical protein